jgi:hypothetical protein
MFQSIWTIFREPTLVLAKLTLFQILPLKFSVKRLKRVSLHTALDTHSPKHGTLLNLLTLHFNGKI